MTILHRAHQRLQDKLSNNTHKKNDGDDSETCKGHGPPLSFRKEKGRRWSFSNLKSKAVREEVEDWLIIATCFMVIFVCFVWFMGKVVGGFTWFVFPLIDSLVPSGEGGVGGGTGDFFKSYNSHQKHVQEMPFNSLYSPPHAHKIVGDRSNEYAILRQDIDNLYPEDETRSLNRARELKLHREFSDMPLTPLNHNSDQIPKPAYDIYNCPETPPPGYPFQWNLLEVIDNWNPEDTNVPDKIFNGLCVFDFQKEFDKAMTYRNAEVPFVVHNDPRIAATAERWNSPGYMERLLGSTPHRTTRSDTNHFLYAIPPPNSQQLRKRPHMRKTAPPGWHEPTEALRMTYRDWLKKANVTDDMCTPDQPHWYYRLIGCGLTGNKGECDRGASEYLYDEMPFFQPTPGGLYLREAEKQKGIHCRFGQKGIVADNHFDAGRNTIVVLGGSRRYVDVLLTALYSRVFNAHEQNGMSLTLSSSFSSLK